MKVTQYVRAEQAIVGADGGGIRQRWLYGLRLLRDPEAISTGNGGGLRHGVTDRLVEAARSRGLKLNDREVRNRLRCARTYPTESQIGHAVSDFGSWHDLIEAGFPPYEAELNEPPADYRTQNEKDHDHARQLLLAIGGQGTLFPDLEPEQATLKELVDYSDEQDDITERFAKRGRERRKYLKELMLAANYDLSQTWQAAHRAAYGSDPA
jgi:hypothetical protein